VLLQPNALIVDNCSKIKPIIQLQTVADYSSILTFWYREHPVTVPLLQTSHIPHVSILKTDMQDIVSMYAFSISVVYITDVRLAKSPIQVQSKPKPEA
jgi:hypothetical protein